MCARMTHEETTKSLCFTLWSQPPYERMAQTLLRGAPSQRICFDAPPVAARARAAPQAGALPRQQWGMSRWACTSRATIRSAPHSLLT